jgi:hypothetical protein
VPRASIADATELAGSVNPGDDCPHVPIDRPWLPPGTLHHRAELERYVQACSVLNGAGMDVELALEQVGRNSLKRSLPTP